MQKQKTMFLQVHDLNDGVRMLINSEDISRVEERNAGCFIYLKTVASDFDKTIHQVGVAVSEDYGSIWKQLDNFNLVTWGAYEKRQE